MFKRAAFLVCLLGLSACQPKLPDGIKGDALMDAVSQAVGDPATCVILAEKGTGKVLWRSSSREVCAVERQACVHPGMTTAEDVVAAAAKGEAYQTGCESVSWAVGPTTRSDVVYVAMMFGERALPGREIARRLDQAFAAGGV